jgi:glycerol-3-phosphate acyltransferase PlsY
MVLEDFILLQKLLASLLVGYLLGSVPFAHLAARFKGVDIFVTGNRRAGTANVFWNVSRRTGVMVFAADVAKGSLAVLIAQLMGLHGPLVILAGGAAVAGHWRSLFTGFKGGDGMATLLGVTLIVVPALGPLCIGIGFVAVILAWKSPYRSAVGIAVSFSLMLGLALYFQARLDLVYGLIGLALLVLTHNVLIRRRMATLGVAPKDEFDALEIEIDLSLGKVENADPDLGPPAKHPH